MAKIRLGGIVAQASGSLDGVVFSHNRNGRYVRARVKPTNPKSVKQQSVRSNLASLSQTWRTLTTAQRNQWTALGAQMTQTNSIGEATTLTGLQAFVSVNQLKLTAGQAVVTTAPVLDSAPTFTPGTLTLTATGTAALTLAFSGSGVASQSFRIYATGNLSAGRNFIRKSQYRLLQTIAGNSTSPVNLVSSWQAAYGTITVAMVGAKVSFLIVPVSTSGIAGPPVRVDGNWV